MVQQGVVATPAACARLGRRRRCARPGTGMSPRRAARRGRRSRVRRRRGRSAPPTARRLPFLSDHRPEDLDDGRTGRVVGCRQDQICAQLVRAKRRPVLPRRDRRGCVLVRPYKVEVGHARRRLRREDERGNDAEVPGARAAQRSEEVGVLVLVALHDPPVGENDLRGVQVIERQPSARPRIPSPPPRVRPAMPTEGHAPVGIASPCSLSRLQRSPVRVPAPTVTRLSPMSTEFRGVTSMTTPRVDERPARQ
jgi:hypothetical protein